MYAAKGHVRFAPNSDRESELPQTVMSALPPKADMCSALAHVCFGPKADIKSVIRCLVSPQINCPGGRSNMASLKNGCGGTFAVPARLTVVTTPETGNSNLPGRFKWSAHR